MFFNSSDLSVQKDSIIILFHRRPLLSPFVAPSLSPPVLSLSPHLSWLYLHISSHVLHFPETSRKSPEPLLPGPAGLNRLSRTRSGHTVSLCTMMQNGAKEMAQELSPAQQLSALVSPLTLWTPCTISPPWGHMTAKLCWWLASEGLERSTMFRFTSVP